MKNGVNITISNLNKCDNRRVFACMMCGFIVRKYVGISSLKLHKFYQYLRKFFAERRIMFKQLNDFIFKKYAILDVIEI